MPMKLSLNVCNTSENKPPSLPKCYSNLNEFLCQAKRSGGKPNCPKVLYIFLLLVPCVLFFTWYLLNFYVTR